MRGSRLVWEDLPLSFPGAALPHGDSLSPFDMRETSLGPGFGSDLAGSTPESGARGPLRPPPHKLHLPSPQTTLVITGSTVCSHERLPRRKAWWQAVHMCPPPRTGPAPAAAAAPAGPVGRLARRTSWAQHTHHAHGAPSGLSWALAGPCPAGRTALLLRGPPGALAAAGSSSSSTQPPPAAGLHAAATCCSGVPHPPQPPAHRNSTRSSQSRASARLPIPPLLLPPSPPPPPPLRRAACR